MAHLWVVVVCLREPMHVDGEVVDDAALRKLGRSGGLNVSKSKAGSEGMQKARDEREVGGSRRADKEGSMDGTSQRSEDRGRLARRAARMGRA